MGQPKLRRLRTGHPKLFLAQAHMSKGMCFCIVCETLCVYTYIYICVCVCVCVCLLGCWVLSSGGGGGGCVFLSFA